MHYCSMTPKLIFKRLVSRKEMKFPEQEKSILHYLDYLMKLSCSRRKHHNNNNISGGTTKQIQINRRKLMVLDKQRKMHLAKMYCSCNWKGNKDDGNT